MPSLSKFLSVSLTHFVYIWWKWKCCNWNSNIIELSMTSPPWYLRIKNPAILSPTDNFLDLNPFLTMMTSPQTQPHWHMPDSVCVPCYKRKSFRRLQSSFSMESFASLRAAFCFICTCHRSVLVHWAASDPPKVNSLPSKSVKKRVYVCPH